MRRWEYHHVVILTVDDATTELNRLGQEGWEVVVGVPIVTSGRITLAGMRYLLKREVLA